MVMQSSRSWLLKHLKSLHLEIPSRSWAAKTDTRQLQLKLVKGAARKDNAKEEEQAQCDLKEELKLSRAFEGWM